MGNEDKQGHGPRGTVQTFPADEALKYKVWSGKKQGRRTRSEQCAMLRFLPVAKGALKGF